MCCMTKSWCCKVEVEKAEEMRCCGETSVESNGSYRTLSFRPNYAECLLEYCSLTITSVLWSFHW